MTAMRHAEVPEVSPLAVAPVGGRAPEPVHTDAVLVDFAAPLPGFAHERSFALTVINEQSLLFALHSRQTPDLRFILVSPGRFFPDYAPEIHEDDVRPLGVVDNDEVQVFVIVTVRDSIADATANLLAPIVFVPGRNVAMQIILSDDRLPLRAPLVASAS